MGDIAEAMLDGTLCSQCGEYLGGDEGFPVVCAGCRREEKRQGRLPRFSPYNVPPRKGTIQCTHCPRWIKPIGMAQHVRDKHPEHYSEGTSA
jgi:hypothetical protein